MRSKRYMATEAFRVLGGMVMDKYVVAKVARVWRPGGLFDGPWLNLVAGWCMAHWQEYEQPVGPGLRDYYERWAGGKADEAVAKGVERFLSYLSEEWADGAYCTDYLLDLAGRHFNAVQARKIAESVSDTTDPDEAMEQIEGFQKIRIGMGETIDPSTDWEFWQMAFDQDLQKPMVTYPGPLGSFVNSTLERDSLVGIMAPDKSGKSWWLIDIACRALRQRRRVAYFELGDLMDREVKIRIGQRVARRPHYAKTVRWPTGFDDEKKPVWEDRELEGLDEGSAMIHFGKAVRHRKDQFRLICRPSMSASANDLEDVLKDFEREGWLPDVVLVDYADILAPPRGVKDKLDQIDATWMILRRISQVFHCLVVVASQSSARAYEEKETVLTRRHFSGRKTKLAHVCGMLGLNSTAAERADGVTRINWIVRRNEPYEEKKCVQVAGCLDAGCPAVVSSF